MTTTTTRYGLVKIQPLSDNVDVVVDFNNNWDAIDLKLGSQVCTSSTRPASPVQGMDIYETDTGATRTYSGSAWAPSPLMVATSSARPANPITGDTIYETDTGAIAVYVGGGNWRYRSVYNGTSSTRPTSVASGASLYETDTKRFLIYNGSSWENKAYIAFVCTSSTHPSSPFQGLVIYETDKSRALIYDGANYVPLGEQLMAAPISTSSLGTATSGTTETFDAVLGYYSASLVSGRRYRVVLDGMVGNLSVANDIFTIQIRDSQSVSNPTSASTLIAQTQYTSAGTGSASRNPCPVKGSFLSTVTGTHTFGVSATRISGTGVFTPVAPNSRELYVEDMGVAF